VTLVVGVANADGVTMGVDSAAMSGWEQIPQRNRKLVGVVSEDRVKMLIGFTTSYRMGNLLALWTPPAVGTEDPWTWAVMHAVPSLRTLFSEGGYLKVRDSREEAGTFLIGMVGARGGVLLEIDDDFQVGECPGTGAVGAGRPQALPLLDLLTGMGFTPSAVVRRTLSLAAKYNRGVVPPFRVASLT
jgi:hypothetical protein